MKDPRRAACNYNYSYNYSYSLRDPGGAYHNGRYVPQILYDSLESLAASGKAGVEMRGKVRP
jgi:hypothetical protein